MASTSFWDRHSMEDKVVQVLSGITYHDPNHHFGHPFLTAYQLAILIKERFPDTFLSFGHPIGGKDSGVSYSFTSYLAGQLSERIRDGTITNVEGGFRRRGKRQIQEGIEFIRCGRQDCLVLERKKPGCVPVDQSKNFLA